MAYLKGKSKFHSPKKSKTLEHEHIDKFLSEADDYKYLLHKVALIIGLFGACRCDELVKLSINDIDDRGTYLLVTLPNTKTNIVRKFTIIGDGYSVNIIDLYKKYVLLRPSKVSTSRFFLNYQKGKCTVQPVGINKISGFPKEIAMFLNLPNPEIYTGHSFRRTSATFLANGGGDLLALKQHGGWKSSSIAEGYVEESVSNKLNIAKKIIGNNTSVTNSVTNSISNSGTNSFSNSVTMAMEATSSQHSGGIHFHGTVNTINFYK